MAYGTVSETRASIGYYFSFYNIRRPCSNLDRQTPDQAYVTWLQQIAAAKSPAGAPHIKLEKLLRRTKRTLPDS